jgi:hypothetical protein
MSELPPDVAVEPEPTDSDPPPESIRPDRPRIWPEEPRAPRPQIKRPMEEWLAEFEQRLKDHPGGQKEMATRRRRPRGLARIVPAIAPARTAERTPAAPASGQPGDHRRGRRRRRGSGRGQPAPAGQGQAPQASPSEVRSQRPQPQGGRQGRRRGGQRAGSPTTEIERINRPQPEAPPGTSREQGDAQGPRRRRRRGRGRGRRGPGGSGPSAGGDGGSGGSGPASI